MSEYDCIGVTSEYLKSLKNKIAELEQQNKELKETLTELSRYSFFDIDWNEAAIIKSLIKSALNNIK